ncbi:MAG: serine protease [Paracoccaceae bacterium]
MNMLHSFFAVLIALALSWVAGPTKAQQFDQLFQNFSSRDLSYNERRYLQTALAFEGYDVGLIDGDWGRMSLQAMNRYSYKEFQAAPEEWHTAVLAFSFYERYSRGGWDMRYFPHLGMSVMLPERRLNTDPTTELFVNYSHRDSSLKISVGRHAQSTVSNLHEFTSNAHALQAEPYGVRKTNFAITTATMSDGTKLYTRSNFIDGAWSTVMVSAQSWDANIFQAVISSISVGESPLLDIARDGKLISVIRTTVAFLDNEEREREEQREAKSVPSPKTALKATPPISPKEESVSSGTGFVVSESGHILTNAHVVDDCKAILVDGKAASLIDASNDFDLALLLTEDLKAKGIAVFSASPALLNSDVTAVGFPYAGLLGGLNVTRGSVSSLRGFRGDDNTFQITAPIQSGNSGGPILASDGEVVGVVVSKLKAKLLSGDNVDVPQNVNFAIRGEIAKLFLAQNQIQPKLSLDDTRIPPEILAQNATQFTTFIECK